MSVYKTIAAQNSELSVVYLFCSIQFICDFTIGPVMTGHKDKCFENCLFTVKELR